MQSKWVCSSKSSTCKKPGECEECSLLERCYGCTNKFNEVCSSCKNREQLSEIKKKYLKRYKAAKRNIERAAEELKEYKCGMIILAQNTARVGGGSAKEGDLSDYMVRMESMEESLKERVQECESVVREVLDNIEGLEDEEEKDVLLYRYIKDMTWEKICVEMNVSWRKVHYIHKRALENFKIK